MPVSLCIHTFSNAFFAPDLLNFFNVSLKDLTHKNVMNYKPDNRDRSKANFKVV